MKKLLWVVFAAILAIPVSAFAQEEAKIPMFDISLSLYAGKAKVGGTDVTAVTANPGFQWKDGSAAGLRANAWFPRLTRSKYFPFDFGLMLDNVNFKNDSAQQSLHIVPSSNPFNPATVMGDMKLESSLTTTSIMIRLPVGVTDDLPYGKWYPYFGYGKGNYSVQIDTPGSSGTSSASAHLTTVGVEYFMGDSGSISVFAEYGKLKTGDVPTMQSGYEHVTLSPIEAKLLRFGLTVHF